MPLLDDYAAACKQQGVSGRDFRLLADKAYSHPSTRTELRSRRIKHTIPERSDQIARRKAKGSTGGRPPAFDAAVYGLRNTVERGFNRLKQWRGIATRYDGSTHHHRHSASHPRTEFCIGRRLAWLGRAAIRIEGVDTVVEPGLAHGIGTLEPHPRGLGRGERDRRQEVNRLPGRLQRQVGDG